MLLKTTCGSKVQRPQMRVSLYGVHAQVATAAKFHIGMLPLMARESWMKS
jgi:hypothetical protein